jgi:hypothetical protein
VNTAPRMTLKREDEIRIALADDYIDGDMDGDWQDFAKELLRELDQIRKTQAPTHIHFKFDDIELTAPIGSGADHVVLDGNPCSETYRFSPRGIVVNKTKLKGVRLLTSAQMTELDLDPNTLLNWRTPRKEPASDEG